MQECASSAAAGDGSVLVNSDEAGGVTLSSLLLQRSSLMRGHVHSVHLQGLQKGDHPPRSHSQSQEAYPQIFLRVRRDVPLPWCLQEAWEVGGERASLPWWQWPPQALPVGMGSHGTSVSAGQ